MNYEIDPCEDFYDFACGNYLRLTSIPEDFFGLSILSQVNDAIEERLGYVLEQESMNNDSRSTAMTKSFYQSCMNGTLINELGLQPLKEILREMGGWPVVLGEAWNSFNFSMVETLYKNHQFGFSTDSIFKLNVEIDKLNSSRRRIELDQADLGLKMEYYTTGLIDPGVQAYLEYATAAAKLLGAQPENAHKEMMEMVLFEIQLSNISSRREDRRNYTKLHNIISIKKLEIMIPQVPWLDFLNNLLPTSAKIDINEELVIADTTYYRNIANLLNTVENRTLANYLIWRVVQEAATYLSEDIRQLEFQLKNAQEGSNQRLPRRTECIHLVHKRLTMAVGTLYIRNFFYKESKAEIMTMEKYLRNSFDDNLKRLDWMDVTTRTKALKKSKLIQSHIAYPDEILIDDKVDKFYENLTLNEYSLLENILRSNIFMTDYERGLLHENVDKSDWKAQTEITESTAYFNFQENSIKLPAGILQGVLFEPYYPNYMKFSGIGMVIGHEITHGFDDRGRQFDAEGNLHNWWDPETEQKFMERAKCIVDQYSSYVVPEIGIQLNTINTQGEDIADNGGTKVAYWAYQQWVKDHGKEEILPGLLYNANQLFWITLAQKYCEKIRPEYLLHEVLTGVHTPAKYRLVGSVSNSPEFAKDFHCPAGTKMNPVNKCYVW